MHLLKGGRAALGHEEPRSSSGARSCYSMNVCRRTPGATSALCARRPEARRPEARRPEARRPVAAIPSRAGPDTGVSANHPTAWEFERVVMLPRIIPG